MSADVVEEILAVDHVARLDHLGRRVIRYGREPARDQREQIAQRIDDGIQLDAGMVLVEAALELIAEERGQGLAGAYALDQAHGNADAAGGEVDAHQRRVPWASAWVR